MPASNSPYHRIHIDEVAPWRPEDLMPCDPAERNPVPLHPPGHRKFWVTLCRRGSMRPSDCTTEVVWAADVCEGLLNSNLLKQRDPKNNDTVFCRDNDERKFACIPCGGRVAQDLYHGEGLRQVHVAKSNFGFIDPDDKVVVNESNDRE